MEKMIGQEANYKLSLSHEWILWPLYKSVIM